MKRREAVKGIILFSLGTGLIYSCTDPFQAVKDLNLDFIKPENGQLQIIDAISKLVVPIQSIPELENHTALPFILSMVDDNFTAKERDKFISGYQNWDTDVEKLGQKLFSKMTGEQQMGLLSRLNKGEEGIPAEMQNFYNVIKSQSLKYLTTSEYYQRKVNYYEMAPGRFYGDVMLADLQNANEV